DPLLADEEDGEDRCNAEDGGRRHQVVLDEVHVREADETEGHHLHRRRVHDHEGPEELVPCPHELDDHERGQSSSVLTGLSGSSPAFFQRSTLMYICWKFPCSIGMP